MQCRLLWRNGQKLGCYFSRNLVGTKISNIFALSTKLRGTLEGINSSRNSRRRFIPMQGLQLHASFLASGNTSRCLKKTLNGLCAAIIAGLSACVAFLQMEDVFGSVSLYNNCASTEYAFFLFMTFKHRNALIVICTKAISDYFLSIIPNG